MDADCKYRFFIFCSGNSPDRTTTAQAQHIELAEGINEIEGNCPRRTCRDAADFGNIELDAAGDIDTRTMILIRPVLN